MVPPTGTQTEQGNLSQKRCDLKNVVFLGYHVYIYICVCANIEGERYLYNSLYIYIDLCIDIKLYIYNYICDMIQKATLPRQPSYRDGSKSKH